MAITTSYYEIETHYPEALQKPGLLGYLVVEMRGLRKYMPKNVANAIYGSFEKTDDGTVLYSATVFTDYMANGCGIGIMHYPDSEFLDDLNWLKKGHCENLDLDGIFRR